MKRVIKRVFSLVMAIAVVLTSVFTMNVTKAYAASGNKAVKSVKLKIGSSNVTKKTKTLYVGKSATIKVTVNPQSAKKSVTFKSNKTSVATVNKKGKVVAKKAGTAKITVTVTGKNNKKKSAYCNIKVKNVAVKKVELSAQTKTLAVGDTTTLKAAVSPSNATNKSVKWSSGNTDVAKVSSKGKVTAVSAGTAVITAKAGNKSAACVVTVVNPAPVVSEPANADISIANSLSDYENTVLTGTNADVKVLITDSQGLSVSNTSVTLSIKAQYGNAANVFGITGDNNNYASAKLTTDEQGYASFTVGLRGGLSYTSTDLYYQSYKLTATVTGSDVSKESTLSFACIDAGDVEVLNNKSILYNDIEPGENATDWYDGIADTWSTNGAKSEEYVSSQKVSAFNEDGSYKDDHRVYITAAPYIILPAKEDTTKIGEYYQAVNASSDEYGVYNSEDNDKTTTLIKDVPAGLQYASVVFSKIELSKYTTLQIKTYDAVTNQCISTYVMDETNMKASDFAYQVPVQEDTAVNVEVSLVSEGQVNDDSNSGYVIDHVEGLYKTQTYVQGDRKEISSTVKWTSSNTYYSENVEMSYDTAKNYITGKYLNEKYSYAYSVPVYPNTGDAVITVTDANNNVLAYYLYPTENQWKNSDGTIYPTNTSVKDTSDDSNGAGYQNKNDISRPSRYGYAIKASKEEVENTVGTFTQEGNVAVVDSKVSGRTNLKATITIPGVTTEQLNQTNGSELYTSVQWAPIPEKEAEEAGDDFYAITAQNITVKAQLYDTNGNKVTTKDKKVVFKVDGEEIEDGSLQTLAANDKVTIQQRDAVSDQNGQATIKFNSSTDEGYVHHLTAECEGFNVKLLVGTAETETELANLYWVKLGLSFTDRVNYIKTVSGTETEVKSTVSSTLDGKSEVQSIDSNGELVNNVDSRQVGSNWIFGYELVGDIDKNNSVTENKVKSISNVKVLLSKSDDTNMTMTTDNMPNGVAKVYSEKSGSATIIGEIASDSFGNETANDVVFTIVDEYDELVGEYKNVGENAPNVSAKLSINLSWENKGKKVNVVNPDGNTLNINEDSVVYIQVVDDYGNPIQNQSVEYSITGINPVSKETATTDSNGIVEVNLPAPGESAKDYSSTISVIVDGTTYSGNTLIYRDTTDAEFALMGASLDATNTENPQIKLTFSSSVNKSMLKTGMFKVSSDTAANYDVESVSAGDNSNTVILTLKSGSKSIIDDTGMVTVSVKPYSESGITYNLVDTNGRRLLSDTVYSTATFMPKSSYTVEATASSDGTSITVVVKNSSGDVVSNLSGESEKNIFAYSSVSSVLGSGSGVAYLSGKSRTLTVSPLDSSTTIFIYYCGASTSVTVKK